LKNAPPSTFSNPINNWDICLSGRVHSDSIHKFIYLSTTIRESRNFVLFSLPSNKETEESCTTFFGENLVEPEIEDLSTCLSTNLVFLLETNHPQEDNLHGMTEEEFQSGPHEEVGQDHHDYIDHWF
jgi:hypothetical protein